MKIQSGVGADDKLSMPEMFVDVWLSPLLSCLESNGNLLPALVCWHLDGGGSTKDPLFYLGVYVCSQLKDPALEPEREYKVRYRSFYCTPPHCRAVSSLS